MEKQAIGSTGVIIDMNRENDGYPEFLESIKSHFNESLQGSEPLFTTNIDGLFDVFLSNLPEEARRHYTCNACRQFINHFGGLVTLSPSGEAQSAIWGDVPEFFAQSVEAMKKQIEKAKISGVFYSKNTILGNPVTGIWQHMSVALPGQIIFKDRLKTPFQAMAEKVEDFRILINSLLEYPVEAVNQALVLLETESLYRSEKVLGVAKWLKDIHTRRSNTRNKQSQNNIVWLAVATAPVGFCHVRSSMIGTLLDDIVAGLPFETISRKFAEKMHPLQYQRPQAAPSAGNIAQAEKIVEKLGIQRSLERRFARLEELNLIWKPQDINENNPDSNSGVFSHLKAKDAKKEILQVNLPTMTMTWKKFFETVLPSVKSMDVYVKARDNFSAILTAQHEDAPPIIQWDSEEKRNPFSWYVYNGGSLCSQWNLATGYCKVTGICYQPSMWTNENAHQSKSVFFIINGAKDKNHQLASNGLFPEILKSSLHEIRSTIEAYSKKAETQGYEEASACGLRLQYGSNWDATINVVTDMGAATYKLIDGIKCAGNTPISGTTHAGIEMPIYSAHLIR